MTFSLTIATEPSRSEEHSRHFHGTAEHPISAEDGLPRLDCLVLLAEDGPDNQRLISFRPRKVGADVVTVKDGQQVVECVLAQVGSDDSFDVILMDMQMPVMNGNEATRTLRQHGCQGPIIALTAHAMTEDRQKCLDAGCDDYLTKPINRESLVAAISHHAQSVPQSLLAQ